jgi:hypothetical protein
MSDNIADKHQKAADLDAAIKDGARRKADMEGNIDKLLTAMDGLTSGMAECQERLAKLEKGGSSGHLPMHGSHHRGVDPVSADGGSPPRSPYSNGPADDSAAVVRSPFSSSSDDDGKAREFGEPRSTVADSDDPNCAIFGHNKKFQPMFYDYQSAADTACRAWGAAAVPPLHGEQLLDYRRRLLRPLMKYSKEFASVDLDELREPLITPIEKSVFADAIKASADNSSVPADYLREVVTTDRTGRRISTFYGQPKTWMQQFSGNRRRVVGFRTAST